MPFIFSNTVKDIVRQRGLYQDCYDRINQKKRGVTAPEELPNLAIHGITPNGTYFYCHLVYQKAVPRQKANIMRLIDAYAKAKERAERIRLKDEIKKACGEQVEGISLIFSKVFGNAQEVYGFVSGNRIKVARSNDKAPLQLDSDELFSESEPYSTLSFRYHVFILDHDREDVPELVRQYFQGDAQNDNIDTDVINAIKIINTLETTSRDINGYLRTVTETENFVLKDQVKLIYDALQLLHHEDEEKKYKATILTLQLLHSQNNEERKQLLTELTQVASDLYGSKIPTDMLLGLTLLFFGASLLALMILTTPVIPVMIIISCPIITMMGIIAVMIGKNEFYNDYAKQKRDTANTLFGLRQNFNNISEDEIIPLKISA